MHHLLLLVLSVCPSGVHLSFLSSSPFSPHLLFFIISSTHFLFPIFIYLPLFLCSLFLLLPVDISVSLLAVVVGFCGLALLVVSLFVFWKLCWPIWRSKALSSNADSCPPGVLPEAPPAQPPVSRSVSPHLEAKALAIAGRQPSQVQQDDEDDKRRKVPEVKVNGRSSVKILEAAMKISQTSPDIPAEVQQALRDCLTKQAKIQRQTTEPTSSSRWYANYMMNYMEIYLIAHWMTLQKLLIISLLSLELITHI